MNLLLLSLLITLIQSNLIYLAQLFRHGARYPVSDIYDGKDTKPYHGQLTSIGMRQQYLLGSYLKRDYIDKNNLFNGTLSPKQVQIYTDTSQRCYESAYAHAAGLFQLNQGEILPQGIPNQLLQPPWDISTSLLTEQIGNNQFALNKGYQPVPIKTGEIYFPSCPNQVELIARRIQAIAVRSAELEVQHAIFSQKMAKLFNLSATLSNIAGMIQLYDVVICDLNLGRAMPQKFTEKDFLEMKYIQNYMFVLLYAQHLTRVVSTPIAKAIINNMQNIIAGRQPYKKLSIYSGHDTNVAPMLTFLNLTTAECLKKKYKNQTIVGNCAQPVPFASSIQFELYEKLNEYYVKVKYNGDYYLLCETNSYQCKFQLFAIRIKHQLVDYNKECGVK